MIDAFRKDFREADWQTDGRNSAGIDPALKRFLFFESTRSGANSRRRSNKEPVENLAAILLHWRTPFPAVRHYLPRWYRFPTSSFPTDISSLVFSIPRLSLPFYLSVHLSPFVSQSKLGSGLFEFPETSLISVSSSLFSLSRKNTRRASRRSEERSRTLTIMEKLIESYLIILLSRIFSDLDDDQPSYVLFRRYLEILDYKLLDVIVLIQYNERLPQYKIIHNRKAILFNRERKYIKANNWIIRRLKIRSIQSQNSNWTWRLTIDVTCSSSIFY